MKINYPGSVKKEKINKITNYGNRGMTLEFDLNETNNYYLEKDIAVIYKKPTPIQVVDTDYGKRKITKAYFKEPSTTDYNGIYKGYYVDYEAKETTNKTAFPLANIHKHQIEHLEKILRHGGICFLIVRFTKLDETYLLYAKDFLEYIKNNDRKSVPLKYFKEKGYIIKIGLNKRLDYLKIIDEYGGNYGKEGR